MYTKHSSYRTWATAAAVFVLLAGLCSVVSGPIAAGAEESDPAWIGGFAESNGYAFAESDWLGVDGDDTPEAADDFDPGDIENPIYEGDGPDISTDVALSGCDATPQLSVTIAISGENAIEFLSVNGTVGEEWVEIPVAVDPGETTVNHTEVIDLTDMKNGADSWWGANNVWLWVDVADVAGGFNFDWVDVAIDFDDCTVTDFEQWVEESGPQVVAGSPTLSECASSPKLTVSYTASDDDGLAHAFLGVVDQSYNLVADFEYEPGTDFDADATEVTFTEIINVQKLRDSGRDYVEVNFDAMGDGSWFPGFAYATLEMDFDACTVQEVEPRPYLVGGDGLYPVVAVTSVEVDQCDATPVLTVGYTVSDSDGIDSITAFNASEDHWGDSEVDFEVGATEVQVSVDFDVSESWFQVYLDAVDSANTPGNSALDVKVDSTDCTVEYIDMNDPDSWEDWEDWDEWYDEDRNGPTIALESLSIASCDTSPVLSVGYAISDEAGVSEAEIYLGDTDSGALVDAGSSPTELNGVHSFEQYAPLWGDEDYLYIEAVNSAGEFNWLDVPIIVDLEDCQVEDLAVG